MNKGQIIQLASSRTENRANGVLDMDLEYALALQEFCEEDKFWWRKKTTTITTVAGTATYDITLSSGANAIDCEEIISVSRVNSDGTLTKFDPVFEREEEILADTQQREPTKYLREPGDNKKIRLYPIPNGAYTVRVVYWATPAIEPDQLGEDVPLVPPQFHRGVALCLEKNLHRFSFGTESAKYVGTDAEYQKVVSKARTAKDFAPGRLVEFRTYEDGIQSI